MGHVQVELAMEPAGRSVAKRVGMLLWNGMTCIPPAQPVGLVTILRRADGPIDWEGAFLALWAARIPTVCVRPQDQAG